jgi:cellobiose transport system permease protein
MATMSTEAAPTWRQRASAFYGRRVEPYAYIAPFFIVFGLFGLAPILYTAWVSLHKWDPLGTQVFIGIDNYIRLYADPRFWNALFNTFSIWFLSTVPQLILAMVLANVLNSALLRLKTPFRMSMLLPNITSVVAVGIIFSSLFGRDYGLINWVIGALGGQPVNWEAGQLSSHVAISTMVMWRWTGYNTLIYLAAMQSIPRELYESAAIDGAGRLRQFLSVTLPQMRPVVIFTIIVSTIGGMQVFAEPLIFGGQQTAVTGGALRQYQTLSLFLYEQGFRNFNFGYAATIAWVLFMIILAFSVVNLLLARRIKSDA